MQPCEDASGSAALSGGAIRITALRVVALAASAGVSIVVARLLGPAGTGQFAVAIAFITIISAVATLGFDTGLTWMVSGDRWSARDAYLTAFRVAWIFGGAGSVGALGLYAIVRSAGVAGPDVGSMLPVICSVPFSLAWIFGFAVALGMERYDVAAVIAGVQVLAYVAGVALLGALFGLEGALVGILLGHVAAAITAERWIRQEDIPHEREQRGIDRERFRIAVGFGSQVYVATVLQIIVYRADLLLLSVYAARDQVGLYAVAVAITNPVWLMPASLSSILFPRVAVLTASGCSGASARQDAETTTLRHTVVMIVALAAIVGTVSLTAVSAIFGAHFADAATPALVLLPGVAALGLSSVLSAGIVGRGHPKYVLVSSLITTPVAVVLYLILVPADGAVGAAIASDVAYLLGAVLAGWFLQSLSECRTLSRVLPTCMELSDYRRLVSSICAATRNALGRVHSL